MSDTESLPSNPDDDGLSISAQQDTMLNIYWKTGQTVEIIGLQTRTEWNGKSAVIHSFDHASQRYVIIMKHVHVMSYAKLRSKNLRPIYNNRIFYPPKIQSITFKDILAVTGYTRICIDQNFYNNTPIDILREIANYFAIAPIFMRIQYKYRTEEPSRDNVRYINGSDIRHRQSRVRYIPFHRNYNYEGWKSLRNSIAQQFGFYINNLQLNTLNYYGTEKTEWLTSMSDLHNLKWGPHDIFEPVMFGNMIDDSKCYGGMDRDSFEFQCKMGQLFLIHMGSKEPISCVVRIDGRRLWYVIGNEVTEIDTRDILQVKCGDSLPQFECKKNMLDIKLCFSIVCKDKSTDFEGFNEHVTTIWIDGLRGKIL